MWLVLCSFTWYVNRTKVYRSTAQVIIDRDRSMLQHEQQQPNNNNNNNIIIKALYIAFPQPIYRGPVQVPRYDTDAFHRVVEGAASAQQLFKDSNKLSNGSRTRSTVFLVMFYSIYNNTSNHFAPLFSELCHKYESDQVRFIKVNIDTEPQLAKRYRINASNSDQLPTFIMFENGQELRRMPQVRTDGTLVSSKATMSQVLLLLYLLSATQSLIN
jgi:thiol-disulfide isomerase/thioredoxin